MEAEQIEKFALDIEAEAISLGLVTRLKDSSGFIFVETPKNPDDPNDYSVGPAGPRLRVNTVWEKLKITYGKGDERLKQLALKLQNRWGDEVSELSED